MEDLRDVMFKAWDGSEFEYIRDLYWFEENGVHDFFGTGHNSIYSIHRRLDIKDKNGQYLFEKDIVKFRLDKDYGKYLGWSTGIVSFNKFELVVNIIGDEIFPSVPFSLVSEFEIIGNAFEIK